MVGFAGAVPKRPKCPKLRLSEISMGPEERRGSTAEYMSSSDESLAVSLISCRREGKGTGETLRRWLGRWSSSSEEGDDESCRRLLGDDEAKLPAAMLAGWGG